MNFSGLLGSALSGMGAGAISALDDREKERLLQQKEDAAITLRQMLLDSRLGSGGGSRSGSGSRSGGGPLSDLVREDPNTVGWQQSPTGRAGFTTNEITGWAGNDPGGMLSDPSVMGPPQEGFEGSFTTKPSFDQVGYNKAETARQASNLDTLIKVEHPGQYDSYKKGEALSIINSKLTAAMGEQDPKKREALIAEATKLSMAAKGEGAYKVQGDTLLDTVEGDARTTELGKAKIQHEKASAAKASREPAAKEPKPESTKDLTAEVDKLTNTVVKEQKRLLDEAGWKEPSAVDALDPKKVAASNAEKVRILGTSKELKSLTEARNVAVAKLNGADSAPVQSTPPLSALSEGKVTTFKNGQKWTIEGGKPKRVS